MKLERNNNKLKNNIIYSSVYQILVLIVPIITTPYVTRIFNSTQMGDYSLSLSVASLFVIVSQFGMETYGNREIAKTETNLNRNNLFFQLLSIQFVISILMFVLYNIIFVKILEMENTKLYFVQSLLILVNVFDIAWYFMGIEEIKKTIFRNTLTKIFTTLSIFIFIKNDNHLILYAILNVIGMLIGNLTMVFSSKHYIDYRQSKFSLSIEHVKGSFKLLLPRLLNSSSRSIENGVLNISTSLSNVGVYNQAVKINNILFAIINSAINALSPRMSYYVSKKDTKSIKNVFNKGLMFSSIFSIIFISGIFAVTDDFVDFFFGDGYEMVSPVLQVLSISLIFIPLMALINRGILIPYGRDKEYTNSVIILLVSTIIFNLILDPRFGAIGAGIAYNISQVFSFIYIISVVRNLINFKKILNFVFLSIICILGNVFIINMMKNVISIDNSFLSFLFFGIISVGINLIILLTLNYYKKS